MRNENVTIEEFQKCEILRQNGYTIKIYKFMNDIYLLGGGKARVPNRRIIAYKGEQQQISEKFAYEHLLENVFDEFVEQGE